MYHILVLLLVREMRTKVESFQEFRAVIFPLFKFSVHSVSPVFNWTAVLFLFICSPFITLEKVVLVSL